MRRLSSILLLILLGVMTSACAKPGKVYPLTLEDTRSLLSSSPELDILVTPGKILTLNSSASTDNQLVWDIHHGAEPLFRFKADLSPENALSTRVVLSLDAGPSSKQPDIQQRLENNPTIHKLYLAAMDEAVSARIERRGFNFLAIQKETFAATTANMGEIHRQMDKGMATAAKRDESRSHSVYRPDYSSSQSAMYDQRESAYDRERRLDKQTAPSVNLNKYGRDY